MKKITMLFSALVIAVVITGCASIQTASKKDLNGMQLTVQPAQDIVHVNGDNWGFYFLWFPIFTGSTDEVGSMKFFEDTVTLGHVANMVTKKSKTLGATKTVDMSSSVHRRIWLFNFWSVQVSANAVK